MPNRVEGQITIEDARMIFRNFSGVEGPMNAKGNRNFGVILDPGLAEQMANDGWNVSLLKPREDDEEQIATPFIRVKVNYDSGRPPRIVMITSKNRTEITEASVSMLDAVEIKTVDIIFTPYNWEVGGNSGVKAYLKTMFITIIEDELEAKYAQVDSGDNFNE